MSNTDRIGDNGAPSHLFKLARKRFQNAQTDMQRHLLSSLSAYFMDGDTSQLLSIVTLIGPTSGLMKGAPKSTIRHHDRAVVSWLKTVCLLRVSMSDDGSVRIRKKDGVDYDTEWFNGPTGPKQVPWYEHARDMQEKKAPELPLSTVEAIVARMYAVAAEEGEEMPDIESIIGDLSAAAKKGRTEATNDKNVAWAADYIAKRRAA